LNHLRKQNKHLRDKPENNWKQQFLYYSNAKAIPDQVIPITIFPTTTSQTTTTISPTTILNTTPNAAEKPSNTVKVVIQTQTTADQNSSNNNIFIIEILSAIFTFLASITALIFYCIRRIRKRKQQIPCNIQSTIPTLPLGANAIPGPYSNQQQLLSQPQVTNLAQQLQQRELGKGRKQKRKLRPPVVGTGLPNITQPGQRYNYYTADNAETSDYPTDSTWGRP